jgi:hypothetical protein
MKLFKEMLFLALITTTIHVSLFSQKANYIGANLTLENSSSNFQPGFGVLFERKFNKNRGIETGIYYRACELNNNVIVNDGMGSRILPLYVLERYISIPILYKLYTRFLNVSAGPTFDFFVGWKQKNKSPLLSVDAYKAFLLEVWQKLVKV